MILKADVESKLLKHKEFSIDQRLRRQRFGYAACTYVVVTLAIFIVASIGIGALTKWQWIFFLGLGVFGNLVFAILFVTNRNVYFSDPSLTMAQIIFSAIWGLVPLYSMPEARPMVLMFFLPAFSFGMLRLTQRQYLNVVAIVMGLYALVLGLNYFHNPDAFKFQYEIFLFFVYGILLAWFAIFGGFISRLRRTSRQQKESIQEAHEKLKLEITERKRAQLETEELVYQLKDALGKVKLLSGLLPICSSCKKIRDDDGNWKPIEVYIGDRSEADFTHGICPNCRKNLYPEFD